MEYSVSNFANGYDFVLTGVSYAGDPRDNTVMYISKKVEHLVKNLENVRCCLVFVSDAIEVPDRLKKENCFVFTDNPQREYALFVGQMARELEQRDRERGYTLTDGGYYVGDNVTIGENACIEPLCLIGHDVVIGKNARISAGARIKHAVIGDNFFAGENCAIGTFGFTMADDDNGDKMSIPTLGGVVIGDNVEIFALTNIARGSAGNTVISDHVRIDALVYVAHDDRIGRNVELPSGVQLGGFVTLGDGAYVGIGATLRNRITVGERAVIGMGAVVTKSVPAGVTVVGNPARLFDKK